MAGTSQTRFGGADLLKREKLAQSQTFELSIQSHTAFLLDPVARGATSNRLIAIYTRASQGSVTGAGCAGFGGPVRGGGGSDAAWWGVEHWVREYPRGAP